MDPVEIRLSVESGENDDVLDMLCLLGSGAHTCGRGGGVVNIGPHGVCWTVEDGLGHDLGLSRVEFGKDRIVCWSADDGFVPGDDPGKARIFADWMKARIEEAYEYAVKHDRLVGSGDSVGIRKLETWEKVIGFGGVVAGSIGLGWLLCLLFR